MIFLGLGITATMGVGHRQGDIVSASIIDMAGVLQDARVAVAKVPVPGDNGVVSSRGLVSKLHL